MEAFKIVTFAVCWILFGATGVMLIRANRTLRRVRSRLPSRTVGTWRRTGYTLLPYQCTACGVYREETTPYCPHCGRPMRLEEEYGKE